MKDFSMNKTAVKGTLGEIGTKSKDIVKFLNKVYHHLHQNKVFHKFETFLLEAPTSDHPWRQANEIDEQIGLAINAGKRNALYTQDIHGQKFYTIRL